MNKLWLKWTLNCGFGELLGIGAAGAIAFGVNFLFGEPEHIGSKIIVLIFMVIAGAFEGFILGLFQWKVLVKKFHEVSAREWIFYTMLIAILGWFLGMLSSLFLISEYDLSKSSINFDHPAIFMGLSSAMGLILGAFFGLFQWFSLRKYALKAYQWIIANALGWALGMIWIFVFASIPNEDSSLLFNILVGITGGILAGLSVGVVTGFYFISLRVNK